MHGNLVFAEETFRIRGAAFEVYRAMGAGFLESVYQECLALEFAERDIPYLALQPLSLSYKGRVLSQSYRADFVCFDRVIVELKAVRDIARASGANHQLSARDSLKVGLLMNFGAASEMQIERFAL